ncbi:MAG: hypothetical protein OEN22_03125 [Gammaproteobacteria bacterium]|nr:hypothetical protein [Gammaproteobacteria bacterium]
MNRRWKYLTGSAIVLSLAAGYAVLQNDVTAPGDESSFAGSADANKHAATPTLAGVSAGMHFTDANGNPRRPSAEERAELAAAFQKDLARLTRGKNIPSGSKLESNGATSAVVGADNLEFLVVTLDENGDASFGHSSMDEDGRVEIASTNELPEM